MKNIKITNYIVKFYRKAEEEGEKNTYLGTIEVDDTGTSEDLCLMAKAFRHAPDRCLHANLVRMQRIQKSFA